MHQSMHVDVLIVGAGVAGLAAALKLLQHAKNYQQKISVCILEKSAKIGEHIISGAVMDTRSLDELCPDWQQEFGTDHAQIKVREERLHLLFNSQHAIKLPHFIVPAVFSHGDGVIISLSLLCRWLAEKVTALGGDIFTGVCGSKLIFDEQGKICGVESGDYGRDSEGRPGANFMPGMRVLARQTLLTEGARGSLARQAIEHFDLASHHLPQHYALGLKEIWLIEAAKHSPGRVEHFVGWPLKQERVNGGLFAYHLPQQRLALGLVADLDYDNPQFSPYSSFQSAKQHPRLKQLLCGGTRLAFGARALAKGGLSALPRMVFPGGMVLGCAAGTLNPQRIKGIHTAMKSAMLAADVLFPWLQRQRDDAQLESAFSDAFRSSWLWHELYQSKDFTAAVQHHGTTLGAIFWWMANLPGIRRLPWHFPRPKADHQIVAKVHTVPHAVAFSPDGVLSFEHASSLNLSRISVRSQQPCHLQHQLLSPMQCEWAIHYCPGGVFSWQQGEQGKFFHINGHNCLHCKTCDIKDPNQTLRWTPPEGGSGPRYQEM